ALFDGALPRNVPAAPGLPTSLAAQAPSRPPPGALRRALLYRWPAAARVITLVRKTDIPVREKLRPALRRARCDAPCCNCWPVA
ncbi:MAG: hypothetical protein J5871_04050, partial [Bacteroidales bacterium]|nr:hypothetical protein [Bacteroidales bacterium]